MTKECYITIGPCVGGPPSSLHSHQDLADRAANGIRKTLEQEGYPNIAARVCVEVRTVRDMAPFVCIPGGPSWSVEFSP